MSEPQRPTTVPKEATWSEQENEWYTGKTGPQGEKMGVWRWWLAPKGYLVSEVTYSHFGKNMHFTRFHPDGTISWTGVYIEDQVEGTHTVYRCAIETPELAFNTKIYNEKIWKIELDHHNHITTAWRYYSKDGEQLDEEGNKLIQRPANVPHDAQFRPKTNCWSKSQQVFRTDKLTGLCQWWDAAGNITASILYNRDGQIVEQKNYSYIKGKNIPHTIFVIKYESENVCWQYNYSVKDNMQELTDKTKYIVVNKRYIIIYKINYENGYIVKDETFYDDKGIEIKSYTYNKDSQVVKAYEEGIRKKYFYNTDGSLKSKQHNYNKNDLSIYEALNEKNELLCKVSMTHKQESMIVQIRLEDGGYFESGNLVGLMRIQDIMNLYTSDFTSNYTDRAEQIYVDVKVCQKIITETPPLFNQIAEKYKWDKKLKPDMLVKAKALFFDDANCQQIGLQKLKSSNDPIVEGMDILYKGLIDSPFTQANVLKLIEMNFNYINQEKENALNKRIWLKIINANPLPLSAIEKTGTDEDKKRVKWMEKEIQHFKDLLVIKPAELENLKTAFGVILNKPLDEFDHKKYAYHHYFYHEFIYEDFKPFMHPKGIEKLKTGYIPYKDDIDGYLMEQRYYDFNNSYFDGEFLLEELSDKIGKELTNIAIQKDESYFIKGDELGKFIVKHKLDFRKLEVEFIPIYAKMKTDGSLFDAMLAMLKELDYNGIENHTILDVEPKFKGILKKIDPGYQHVFKSLFLTEDHARCYGFYYNEKEDVEFSSVIEIEKQEVVASWAMTESVFSFVIVRQEK